MFFICYKIFLYKFETKKNTNGNTIGTVVANTIIRHIFGKKSENARFNALRLLEDFYYQAAVRQSLIEVKI